jgi:hypothetical protein
VACNQMERLIVDLKRDKPYCGARKIRELLVRKLAGDVRATVGARVCALRDFAPPVPILLV